MNPKTILSTGTTARVLCILQSETLALIDKRSRARVRLSKAKLRREIKKAVRADKAQYYSDLAHDDIAAYYSENTRKMFSLIKKLSGIGPTTTDILKDESEHSTTDGKLFRELNIPSANGVIIAPTAGILSGFFGLPFLRRNHTVSFHKLKNNQTGGIDGLLLSCFAVVPHQYANRCSSLRHFGYTRKPPMTGT